MEQNALSECELLIMKAIWRSERAMSIQEISEKVESLYETNWKTQTVSVFLGRMVKKGFLTSERKGKQYLYHPAVTEDEYMGKEAVKCVEYFGDGKADLFLSALSKGRKISKEEKDKIRGILDELD